MKIPVLFSAKYIFFSVGMFLAMPFFVSAATEVTGNITTDTTWTASEGPYVLYNQLDVEERATLTIERGVIVRISPDIFINVYGTLTVEGTATDPVYFTSLYDDSRGGDVDNDGGLRSPSRFDGWGINFFGAATSTLRNFSLWYSGGFFANFSRVVLEDVAIRESEYGFLADASIVSILRMDARGIERDAVAAAASDVSVKDSAMRDIGRDAFGFYDGSIFSLDGSMVEDLSFGSAVGLYENSSAKITKSEFRSGLDDCIELYGGSSIWLIDSLVENFVGNALLVYDDNRSPYKISLLLAEKSIFQNNGIGVASYGKGPVIVTESVIMENSIYGVSQSSGYQFPLDARGNFWGDASGPYHSALNPTGAGNPVSNGVLFDPWLTEEPRYEPPPPPVAECCSNVAFIPGLQATRLDLDGNRLWEPSRNLDVEKLYFTDDGHPITAGIRTDGIIGEAAGFNIYKNFILFMDELVATGTNKEWQPFPYDWRFSAEDIVEDDMVDELLRFAESSPTGKVTIITHSNGGLVAKALISKLEAEGHGGLVDKLIMVAAPQLGTPKAIAGILHGDEQTIPSKLGFILSKRTARGLAEDMPSAYALLPSKKYFSDVFDPVIEFDSDVAEIYDFPALYGESIETSAELESFLLGDYGARWEPHHEDTDAPNVLDADLLWEATSTQAILDAWQAPAGVKVIQIAGWGLDTIRGIRYDDCDIPLCSQTLNHLDRELLLVHDGDGTVVIPSAVAMEGAETYYVNLPENNFLLKRNRDHADILEVETIRMLIKSLIKKEAIGLLDFISKEKPVPKEEDKKLRFRIYSPVSLDLYDEEGNNHTGLIPNFNLASDFQHIEQELPNSYYLEFGETKYAGADTFATTTVVLIGQTNGTFTFEIDEVLGDELVATTSFSDIPVIEGARITTDIIHIASSTVIFMDVDGDGIVDAIIEPGEGVSMDELLDILRGLVGSLNLDANKEVKLLKSIDKLEKILNKDHKDEKTTKKKTAYTIESLERIIENFQKKGLLTAEEAGELLHIIGQIKVNMIE